jgi:hypothetical protein
MLSTVISSVLDQTMREAICAEAMRVTAPDGSILWYDIRRNNPSNPHVRRVAAGEVRRLFPGCEVVLRSSTLIPPVARLVTARAELLARMLEALPALRTHWTGVIRPHGARP